MKLPLGWLRDYVDLELSSDDLASRLAMLGFPVDAVERRPHLSGIVAGRLTKVEKHPNADRLLVCQVDVGGAPLTIATAATNVAEGQIVPVAVIGAKLVGLDIALRTMRGIESQGMLVSAGEIGFDEEWFEDGILQLEPDVPLGTDIVALHRLSDDVLDVEVTANRVDAMSIIGIARELAAALGKPVRPPDLTVKYPSKATDSGSAIVELENLDCRRFVAQRFSNVSVRRAPFWMRVRLALAGQRPINNLVDISNFVMLETGQPLHLYDFDKLAGGRLIVRNALLHETITTLDGEVRKLEPTDLVIADVDHAQCLAGLRGARESEVTDATHELLLEAASFSGPRIRRMSIAHGLRTDASSRHEKGLPLVLGELGAARAAHLLQAEGAVPSHPVAIGVTPEPRAPIVVTAAQVHALLGMLVSDDEIEVGLRGLGFEVVPSGDGFAATPPPWRDDVTIREDVIEEIGRVAGYDRIIGEQPVVFEHGVSSRAYRDEHRLAHALQAAGYREVVTLSLQPASASERHRNAGVELPGALVEITNPLTEDHKYLRFSLLPGLLELVARYEDAMPLHLFEIGHVFFENTPNPEPDAKAFETEMLAWLAATPQVDEPDWRDSSFLAFKSDSLAIVRALAGVDAVAVTGRQAELHPGRSATLLVDGRDVATVGAVDPRLLAAYGIGGSVYAGFARIADLPPHHTPRYVPGSRYPAIERDLALIVAPEIPAMDIEQAARLGADGVVAGVAVFDEYRGPQIEAGKKSVAVRIVLQRGDATLTDAEADAYIAEILKSLQERCGARLRA
jgi:phenylalanyl-tRNA synthetase beta chain